MLLFSVMGIAAGSVASRVEECGGHQNVRHITPTDRNEATSRLPCGRSGPLPYSNFKVDSTKPFTVVPRLYTPAAG